MKNKQQLKGIKKKIVYNSDMDMDYLLHKIQQKEESNVLPSFIGIIIGILVVAILIVIIMPSDKKTDEDDVKLVTTEEVTTVEEPDLQAQCEQVYYADKEFLMLVNNYNPLDENYEFEHHTLNCGYDIDARIYDDLSAMLTALNNDGLHYNILSAYRSREDQTQILEDNVARNMEQGMSEEEAYEEAYRTVQKVGCSEHETGLCFDITEENTVVLTESVEESPVNIWLMEHCHEYGFILRYPKDKEDITGISYEPWHFRYVGKEAAKFMYENDLTLEEFYMLLIG